MGGKFSSGGMCGPQSSSVGDVLIDSRDLWNSGTGTSVLVSPDYCHMVIIFPNDRTSFHSLPVTQELLEEFERDVWPVLQEHQRLRDQATRRMIEERNRHCLALMRQIASGEIDPAQAPGFDYPEDGRVEVAYERATGVLQAFLTQHLQSAA